MGASGAERRKSEDPLMEKMREEITPYRMNQLMKVAAKVVELMVNGVFHLTYEEMEIVTNIVRNMLEETADKNGKFRAERSEEK